MKGQNENVTEGFKRLADIVVWEENNCSVSISEMGRLMELSDEVFEAELERMAREYHKERYEG